MIHAIESFLLDLRIAILDPILNFYYVKRFGQSRAKYKQQVEGRTPLLEMMGLLEMTRREASRFLSLFEKIDTDHSGTIDMYEFFEYFDLEPTLFARRAFTLMDFGDDHDPAQMKRIKCKVRKGVLMKTNKRMRPSANPGGAPNAPDSADNDMPAPGQQRRGSFYISKKRMDAKDNALTYAEFFTSLYNYCTCAVFLLVAQILFLDSCTPPACQAHRRHTDTLCV